MRNRKCDVESCEAEVTTWVQWVIEQEDGVVTGAFCDEHAQVLIDRGHAREISPLEADEYVRQLREAWRSVFEQLESWAETYLGDQEETAYYEAQAQLE